MRRVTTPIWRAVALAVTLATVAACSGSSSPAAAPATTVAAGPTTTAAATATTTTKPAAGAATKSPGCSLATPTPIPTATSLGDSVQTIDVNGVSRSYRLAVPKPSSDDTPHPLIMNLHGSGSNALQQSVYSQIPAIAPQKFDAVVLTPDAIANNWRLFSSNKSPTGSGAPPDLAFAHTLIEQTENQYCIDESRIYATGISLGAAYSADLACTLPDVFAAVGLVAVEVPFPPCRPLPVIEFHGTADPVVPYDKGKVGTSSYASSAHPGTDQLMAQWAKINRCSPTPTETMPGSQVLQRTWSGCAGGIQVIQYRIEGGGHTWPGSPIKVVALGPTTDQVDATALILAFFAKYHLPRPH